jgi:adenylosuccinate synthase
MKLVIIGAQWGDEGKGKVVDFLAEGADVVLRYSGGANAGHTVVIEDRTFKLHLIPSGLLSAGKQAVLGSGMVVDLQVFFEELQSLESQGIAWQGRIFVSDRAHLVLPRYKELDREQEKRRRRPLGTTGRGIGVTYALKAHRDGIRVADMYDPQVWETLDEQDRSFLEPYRTPLEGMVVDVCRFMQDSEGRDVLFEGAQGSLLDLDLGTYPFVSSGMSCAAGAAVGAGIGPHAIDRVMGVFKAYATRVGSGPFPTELTPERGGKLGDLLRELGREYGVTTGRPRRCGWLDLVALRYACRSNSVDALALTKLDVLDEMEEIEVCTAYRLDGGEIQDFPASIDRLNRVEPILEKLPGWRKSCRGCRRYEELPDQARRYIDRIEGYTGTPVEIVSVGGKRTETIVRRSPWTLS